MAMRSEVEQAVNGHAPPTMNGAANAMVQQQRQLAQMMENEGMQMIQQMNMLLSVAAPHITPPAEALATLERMMGPNDYCMSVTDILEIEIRRGK